MKHEWKEIWSNLKWCQRCGTVKHGSTFYIPGRGRIPNSAECVPEEKDDGWDCGPSCGDGDAIAQRFGGHDG